MGVCAGNNKIFLIYGKSIPEKKAVDRVVYYDQSKKEWKTPHINAIQPIIARYGVTCSYFSLSSGSHYIYVFGGNSDEVDIAGKTQIYNIVEYFTINFEKDVFTHYTISKTDLYKRDVPYLPYLHSHAVRFDETIIIFGGEHFSRSQHDVEENKVFCLNYHEKSFARADANIEDYTNKSIKKKSNEEPLSMRFNSENSIMLNKCHFTLTKRDTKTYMICQISPSSNQNFDDESQSIIYPKSKESFGLKMCLYSYDLAKNNQAPSNPSVSDRKVSDTCSPSNPENNTEDPLSSKPSLNQTKKSSDLNEKSHEAEDSKDIIENGINHSKNSIYPHHSNSNKINGVFKPESFVTKDDSKASVLSGLQKTQEVTKSEDINESKKKSFEEISNEENKEVPLKSKRINHKKENQKSMTTAHNASNLRINATSLGIKTRSQITYHCLQNLRDAHSSIEKESIDERYFLCPSGSDICRSEKGDSTKAKMAIYDSESESIFPIFLEICQFSSLNIWNSAAYLYFDKNMSNKFGCLTKFKDCLMYSDLREAFDNRGKTKGIAVFAPVFSSQPELVNRAVIADEDGIYLIGGARVNKQSLSKHPLIETNYCSYFELNELKEISTEELGRNNMDSMKFKRDSVVVAQTKRYIFALGGQRLDRGKFDYDPNTIRLEIYDKENGLWNTRSLVLKTQDTSTFSIMNIVSGNEGKECLLIISNKYGKSSTGFVVDIMSIMTEEQDSAVHATNASRIVTRIEKLVNDSNESRLIWTGAESFQIQNTFSFPNNLILANFKGASLEVSNYHL